MNDYALSLQAHLACPDNSESELAVKAQTTQATINRYRNGVRFPSAENARRIDGATGGRVPFDLWKRVAAERAGIA